MPDDAVERKRREIQAKLMAVGLLPSKDRPAESEPSEIEAALDLLRSRLPGKTDGEPRAEMEAMKTRLVAMKGQLAMESQRARVAENSLRQELGNRLVDRKEREALEEELRRVTAQREHLERQVDALVDHENLLLRFMDRLREFEAAMTREHKALAARLAQIEKRERLRDLADRRARKKHRLRRRRIRRLSGVLCWGIAGGALASALGVGVPHTPWAWLAVTLISACGAIAGSWLMFDTRRRSFVVGLLLGAADLILNIVGLYLSHK